MAIKPFECRLDVENVAGKEGQNFAFGRCFGENLPEDGVRAYVPTKAVEKTGMVVGGSYHVIVAENYRPERRNTPLFVVRCHGLWAPVLTPAEREAIMRKLGHLGVASRQELQATLPRLDADKVRVSARGLWREGYIQRIVRIPEAGSGPEEELWAHPDFRLTSLLED